VQNLCTPLFLRIWDCPTGHHTKQFSSFRTILQWRYDSPTIFLSTISTHIMIKLTVISASRQESTVKHGQFNCVRECDQRRCGTDMSLFPRFFHIVVSWGRSRSVLPPDRSWWMFFQFGIRFTGHTWEIDTARFNPLLIRSDWKLIRNSILRNSTKWIYFMKLFAIGKLYGNVINYSNVSWFPPAFCK
jgi:hypothetical protein